MKFSIYEINYSVSPGGEDTWAVSSEEANWYEEGFDSAEQAFRCITRLYPKEVLEIEVKSLAWYFDNYEKEEASASV